MKRYNTTDKAKIVNDGLRAMQRLAAGVCGCGKEQEQQWDHVMMCIHEARAHIDRFVAMRQNMK